MLLLISFEWFGLWNAYCNVCVSVVDGFSRLLDTGYRCGNWIYHCPNW
jgi:hypothetical protein